MPPIGPDGKPGNLPEELRLDEEELRLEDGLALMEILRVEELRVEEDGVVEDVEGLRVLTKWSTDWSSSL